MLVERTIFRAYDIRGTFPHQLNATTAFLLGRAIGTYANERGEKIIVTARDGRLSSEELQNTLNEGIMCSGPNVINIDMVPTPVLYHAALTVGTGSGVMVTGSHNPPDYNGFKIMIGGNTLFGDNIQTLYKIIFENSFDKGSGTLTTVTAITHYLERIFSDIKLSRRLKIAVDCGNGVAGVCAEQLFESLGCDVVPVFTEVDGHFPNHHPNPSELKNLEDLIRTVKKEKCEVGFAFDGDADRVGVVTEKGEIIYADRLIMCLSKDLLQRNPDATVIYDVKCSRRLRDIIEEAGGHALMWKTGHSLIKAKMQETGALLAGEMSGHIFFRERWFGFDDGLYTAARLLEIFSKSGQPISSIFDAIPNDISTPELNLEVADDQKYAIVARLADIVRRRKLPVSTIDGVRIDLETGWGLVRCSNTTPNLVLRFEAESEYALESIKHELLSALKEADPSLEISTIC